MNPPVEIPAARRQGQVQAVFVSTHREGCNVDDPTTQEVGKLPRRMCTRWSPPGGCMGLGAGAQMGAALTIRPDNQMVDRVKVPDGTIDRN
jgi:hypothetical protein